MKNRIIDQLARDAGALVAASEVVEEEPVQGARKRVVPALKLTSGIYGKFREKAVEGTAAVDDLVRRNSYQATAIGLVIGAILGIFSARRYRGCCPKGESQEGTG